MSCQTGISHSPVLARVNLNLDGDNLITSHQVDDYMSSALVPAEAVENDKEHIVATR